MQRLSLIIPELYAKCTNERPSRLAGLSLLISRAKQKNPTTEQVEEYLFRLFNFSDLKPLPIAAITALADGIDVAKKYWIRLDPVEFRADFSAIYLLGNSHLSDIEKVLQHIAEKFKALLEEENLTLQTPASERWYLGTEQDPEVQTTFLQRVIGKDIGKYMPKGTRGMYWQRLITEMQMLMRMQNLNQQEGSVNGFWLWGEGQCPIAREVDWQYVMSDEPIAKGLAILNHVNYLPLAHDFSECQQAMRDANKAIIVLNSLQNISLTDLDKHWFLPIVMALRTKSVAQVDCYFGDGFTYSITPQSIRYFWRRKREL